MHSSNIYTFITEWNEGTYIHQVEADNFFNAIGKWLDSLAFRNDLCIADQFIDKLINILKESEFAPLTGLISIWCTSIIFDDKLLITHAILTSIDEMENLEI